MAEVKDHKAYQLLESAYGRVSLDYVILSLQGKYAGFDSHKAAVIEAFSVLARRFANYGISINIDESKMDATEISTTEFLELPSEAHFLAKLTGERSYSAPKPLPYWFAFLQPPHGAPYTENDFAQFNNALFPNKDHLHVYRWNDEFSNYFDAGKEWWGTGLWSAIDTKTGIAVIIGASLTD